MIIYIPALLFTFPNYNNKKLNYKMSLKHFIVWYYDAVLIPQIA